MVQTNSKKTLEQRGQVLICLSAKLTLRRCEEPTYPTPVEKNSSDFSVAGAWRTVRFPGNACSAASINLFAQSGKRNGEYLLIQNAKEYGPSRCRHNEMTTEMSRMFRKESISGK
jgi:hypothetical protein